MDLSSVQSFLVIAAIFIFSIVLHEVSHGAAALALGDPTAKILGRLTLNPIRHLDPFGSIILPGMMLILNFISGGHGLIFGWAKPVPYNPYNLRNRTLGPALVGLAGPGANIFLAVIFGLIVRFLASGILLEVKYQTLNIGFLIPFFATVVLINLWIALFNLVPIPPLDGSKLLALFLPYSRVQQLEFSFLRYGPISLILLLVLVFPVLLPLVLRVTTFLFQLIVGIGPSGF